MKVREVRLTLCLLPLLCLTMHVTCWADGGAQALEQKKACAEYNAELTKVTSCKGDDDCGQPIKGTSCGCTRDLVARKDADLKRLAYLEQAAKELIEPGNEPEECRELTRVTTCDCPEAEGFACVNQRCTWKYRKLLPETLPRP